MAISVVSFSFSWCSTGGPGAQLSAECWLSLPHLVTNGSPKFTGGPEGPEGRVLVSLPHLVSNSSYLQLIRGPRGPLRRAVAFSTTSCLRLLWSPTHWRSQGPLRPGVVFPTTSCLYIVWLPTPEFLSGPSYIIVQRPLNLLLILSNGIFDRHQAEITVMQFRGHSLPVHQSMSVSWAFTLSHFVSQIRLRDFFRLMAIVMCHFFPVHHFRLACLAGSKVKIRQKNSVQ